MHQPKEVYWTVALSKALLEKVCCTRSMNLFASLTILTQAMLVTKKIGSPLLAIAHSLEKIW